MNKSKVINDGEEKAREKLLEIFEANQDKENLIPTGNLEIYRGYSPIDVAIYENIKSKYVKDPQLLEYVIKHNTKEDLKALITLDFIMENKGYEKEEFRSQMIERLIAQGEPIDKVVIWAVDEFRKENKKDLVERVVEGLKNDYGQIVKQTIEKIKKEYKIKKEKDIEKLENMLNKEINSSAKEIRKNLERDLTYNDFELYLSEIGKDFGKIGKRIGKIGKGIYEYTKYAFIGLLPRHVKEKYFEHKRTILGDAEDSLEDSTLLSYALETVAITSTLIATNVATGNIFYNLGLGILGGVINAIFRNLNALIDEDNSNDKVSKMGSIPVSLVYYLSYLPVTALKYLFYDTPNQYCHNLKNRVEKRKQGLLNQK